MVSIISAIDSDSENVDADVDVELNLFDINNSMCSNKRKLGQLLECNIFLTDEAHTRNPKIV